MFNCGFQGEMRFNKDTNMEGAKKHLGKNHTKTQSHEEPPLNPKTAVEDRKRVFFSFRRAKAPALTETPLFRGRKVFP